MRRASSYEFGCDFTPTDELRADNDADHALAQPERGLEDHNSLGLGRSSIDYILPVPRIMLSQSNDFRPRSEQDEQEQIGPEICHEEEEIFVQSLGLNELLPNETNTNTKNVLRNFGNAQNQYALYHRKARTMINMRLNNVRQFDEWIRKLKLQKFQDFQAIWGKLNERSIKGIREANVAFRKVYRLLCYTFYVENAIPYVLASRMKSKNTKKSHLQFVYRFLQGLRRPEEFNYFKKVSK